MTNFVDQLRTAFPFHLEPVNPGDNGEAFACFLNFASGPSEAGAMLRSVFFAETGTQPQDSVTPEETGRFIDWLIVNAWGKTDGPLPH